MAKVRRVIRKTETPAQQGFDSQFWPVLVSLFVLGGFLLGVILVYLPGQPAFWPCLIGLPVLIGGLIVGLSMVNNRVMKRSMQMALTVSVIAHVLLFIFAVEVWIFAKYGTIVPPIGDIDREKKVVVVPDLPPLELQKEKPDFLKAPDTETPDPKIEEVEKEEQKPEEPQIEKQPVPTPEQEKTTEPKEIKKQKVEEVAPRASQQQSKLSKQKTKAATATGMVADIPKVEETKPPANVQAKTEPQVKQSTQPTVQRRQVDQKPTTVTEAPKVELTKRQNDQNPKPETTSTNSLQRQQTKPEVTPVVKVAVDVPNPTVPKKTTEQTKPNNVAQATKQNTTAPPTERKTVEIRPDTPQNVTAKVQPRQDPSQETPNQPQTPVRVPNRVNRQTLRPTVETVAENVVTPTVAPQPSPRQPTPREATTSPTRTDTSTPIARRTEANPVPNTPRTQVTTDVQKRQVQDAPTAQANPTAQTVSRQAPRANIAPQSTEVAQVATPTNTPPSKAVSATAKPSTTAAARQATTGAQVTKSDTQPSAAAPTATASPTASQTAQRQPRAEKAPTVATSSASVSRQRTSTVATPSVSTTVSEVSLSQAPVSSSSPTPRPSSSQVSRQTSSSPTATRTQTAMAQTSRSPSSAVPRPTTTRNQTASQPSIDANVDLTATPSRTRTNAAIVASPTPVESPSPNQAASGTGNPSAQPAKTALTKSDAGSAGAGRTQNLDRAFPAAAGAASVASNSANRSRATQTNEGPALAPSQPAQLSRSIAAEPLPSTTLTANTAADVASVTGSSQPAQVTATASATTILAGSNAESGTVSASKGTVDVDLGPPKVVADSAAASERAAGGGQPTINPKTNSRDVARRDIGGAPQMTVASLTVDDAQSPAKIGGGEVSVEELNIDATAAVRAESGGGEPASGGPTKAALTGPPTQVSTADKIARLSTSRAEAAETAPGETSAGGGDPNEDEDDEEKKKRLARSNLGGAMQLAVSTPTVADIPTPPPGNPGGGGQPDPGQVTGAQSTEIAKAESAAPAPAATGPSATQVSAPLADAGGGEIAGLQKAGRAEAADATPGQPALGGGTSAPARTATGPAFATDITAVEVAIEGGPSGVGNPDVPSLNAAGVEATRIAGGVTGPALSGPAGAISGQTVVAAVTGTLPGTALGQRQSATGTDGPALASTTNAGAPYKRTGAVGLPAGSIEVAMVDVPGIPGLPAATPDATALLGGSDVGDVARQSGGGLIVDVPAVEGPGGLGQQITPTAGLNNRRARLESPRLSLNVTSRFARTELGGDIATNTVDKIAIPRKGFSGRSGPGGPQTEETVESGLVFLERHQKPDGSWSLNNFGSGPEYRNEEALLNSDTAATGMALLAFQGAGYHHLDYRYKDTVRKAIYWLVKHQKDDGDLYVPYDDESNLSCWLYSHSIAALALSEAYGMTQDPNLKEPAQKALDFIAKTQHKERGGWRYSPQRSSDTSVTGWMFMALHSGELAGLTVPKETYVGIEKWLDNSQASTKERHLYTYNYLAANTPTQRHGRLPSKTMTSVGLLMRLYTGWKRENKHMIKGADYLMQHLPNMSNKIERDTYYWYYATQVMAHMKGKYWDTWNKTMHPLLLQTQLKRGPMAGSWDPVYPVEDRWGPHGGRIYVTCLNLLSLEVKYRLLPLYEDTVK